MIPKLSPNAEKKLDNVFNSSDVKSFESVIAKIAASETSSQPDKSKKSMKKPPILLYDGRFFCVREK